MSGILIAILFVNLIALTQQPARSTTTLSSPFARLAISVRLDFVRTSWSNFGFQSDPFGRETTLIG